MRYIDNYHRIGNMIPIPFMAMNEEFNRPRGTGYTKDFGGWTQFVEVNYLQDFCDEELHPIEYWPGHFMRKQMAIILYQEIH